MRLNARNFSHARLATEPDFLASVDLFAGLSKKERSTFQKLGRMATHLPNRKIIEQGSRARESVALHIIIEGNVNVVENGKLVNELGKGDCFGELALIDGKPRSADVITTKPTDCFILDRTEFQHYLDKHPKFALNMLVALCKKLRDTSGRASL